MFYNPFLFCFLFFWANASQCITFLIIASEDVDDCRSDSVHLYMHGCFTETFVCCKWPLWGAGTLYLMDGGTDSLWCLQVAVLGQYGSTHMVTVITANDKIHSIIAPLVNLHLDKYDRMHTELWVYDLEMSWRVKGMVHSFGKYTFLSFLLRVKWLLCMYAKYEASSR